MRDLTLDMCILTTASHDVVNYSKKECIDLLKRMTTNSEYYLALDDRNKIRSQYDNNLSWDKFGQQFIQHMASMGRIKYIRWSHINQNIRTQLETKGFSRNNEDYKYVVVASNTCCHIIVTHESHFFNVENILRRMHVYVQYPKDV